MGPVNGRQPRRGRVGQDHRDIERARPHDDRPAAAGPAQDRHAVGPAGVDAAHRRRAGTTRPARRHVRRLPEPKRPFPAPGVGLDQEGLVERQVFGDARAGRVPSNVDRPATATSRKKQSKRCPVKRRPRRRSPPKRRPRRRCPVKRRLGNGAPPKRRPRRRCPAKGDLGDGAPPKRRPRRRCPAKAPRNGAPRRGAGGRTRRYRRATSAKSLEGIRPRADHRN